MSAAHDIDLDHPLVARALAFAEEAHRGQVRKANGHAFIGHPRRVAALLAAHGYPPETVAAGLLHDVVEDTDHTIEDVEAAFGTEVARLVAALTEDPSLAYDERKAAHRDDVRAAGAQAQAVFAADVLANVADMRACYQEQGEALACHFHASLDRQVDRFAAELAMLSARHAEPPFVALARAELAGLRADRAVVLRAASGAPAHGASLRPHGRRSRPGTRVPPGRARRRRALR
jgi:guanosine-3',5'-bis(diphosphate) 3'-pyrophosphohydrolase